MSNLYIDMNLCMSCDICISVCAQANAISKENDVYSIDQVKCVNCKACINMCMAGAIKEKA